MADRPTIRIRTLNCKRGGYFSIFEVARALLGGGAQIDFVRRLVNMALLAAEKDIAAGHVTDLFGLNECMYDTVTTGSGQRMSRREIPCFDEGDPWVYAPSCFGFKWMFGLFAGLIDTPFNRHDNQYGEVGIVCREDRFERVSSWIKENIGSTGWMGLGPPNNIIGSRFKIRGTDYVLPFYSTHLRHNKTEECFEIIKIVRDNWRRGDLPPVVVGDFNMDRGTDISAWRVMGSEFFEVCHLLGHERYDQIWVGRPANFDSFNFLVPVWETFELGDEFADGAVDLTDHCSPCIQLKVVTKSDEICDKLISEVKYTIDVTPPTDHFEPEHNVPVHSVSISEGDPGLPSSSPTVTEVGWHRVVFRWELKQTDWAAQFLRLSLFERLNPNEVIPAQPPQYAGHGGPGSYLVRSETPTREDSPLWHEYINLYWQLVPGADITIPQDDTQESVLYWPGNRYSTRWINPLYAKDLAGFHYTNRSPANPMPLRVATTIETEGEHQYLLSLEVYRRDTLRLFVHPVTIQSVARDAVEGCFIASAAYGSPYAEPVQRLRTIRDEMLRKTSFGSALVDAFEKVYYWFSPHIASTMRQSPRFLGFMRRMLVAPIVTGLNQIFHHNNSSSHRPPPTE